MEITTDFLVQISIIIISFSVIVIMGVLAFLFFSNKKTAEEKKASSILNKIEQLKKSNGSPKDSANQIKINKSDSSKIDFEKTDSSLKNLLIKKFKPKIESQLGSKVNIIEFNSADSKLTALIDIADVKIVLSLDSSGKIIDYKKMKSN
jgi:hypothetical protein